MRYGLHAALRYVALLPLLLLVSACHSAPDADALAARYAAELRQTERLVLATMTVGKMATVSDLPLEEAHSLRQKADALIDKMKIGSRVAVYSFSSRLEAYIDLSSLSPSDFIFSPDGKSVAVSLPPVMTGFAGRDFEMREEHYRVTGMRSQINAPERARLKERMTADLMSDIERDAAYREILLEKGRAKAAMFFKELFASRGIDATVTFR